MPPDWNNMKAVGVSLTGNGKEDGESLAKMIDQLQAPEGVPSEAAFMVWAVSAIFSGLMRGPNRFRIIWTESKDGHPLAVLGFVMDGDGKSPGSAEQVVPFCVIPSQQAFNALCGGETGHTSQTGEPIRQSPSVEMVAVSAQLRSGKGDIKRNEYPFECLFDPYKAKSSYENAMIDAALAVLDGKADDFATEWERRLRESTPKEDNDTQEDGCAGEPD